MPEPKLFNLFSLKFFPRTEITDMALGKGIITKKDLDDQLNIESPRYSVSDIEEQRILNRMRTYSRD